MTAIRFAASIVLGLVATTSAFAAEPNAAPAPAAAVTVASTSVATSRLPVTVTVAAGPAALAYRSAPNARYCFRTTYTGSHIAPRFCKTRAEWQTAGIDLDAALAGN
ncbi:hypothetical protein [Sphingomonas sp. Leaf62]|uniref:hypothetical protein n=1 Tax=Sphingomonas sp. Leaf62 TaxID=1736228 RepID=UPI0006F60FD4|nr:hypothetical protein [Sphingomonas sp. Leaf62]KQN74545.1 hypothetical protein ASE91_02030 [Sphingomonas sp. Leaf62]